VSMASRPLEQEVRQFVREYNGQGNSYIKSRRVSKALDESIRRVTPIMQDMVREGSLSVWSESTGATVYRIQL